MAEAPESVPHILAVGYAKISNIGQVGERSREIVVKKGSFVVDSSVATGEEQRENDAANKADLSKLSLFGIWHPDPNPDRITGIGYLEADKIPEVGQNTPARLTINLARTRFQELFSIRFAVTVTSLVRSEQQ